MAEEKGKYPECEKALEVKDESQAIGRFLDWISEQRVELSKWGMVCKGHDDGDYYCETEKELADCNRSYERLKPVHTRPEQLLADYFGIDLKKQEEERQSMLDDLRKGGN